MGAKKCKSCIYLVKAIARENPVFICTNRDDAKGRLFSADLCTPCRNYRTEPLIDRPAVKQPENSYIRFIPLTKGKVAIVDAEDYDWLNSFKWSANERANGSYACSQIKGKKVFMHRIIMNPPTEKVVDHIDHNGLNNRRTNLRICSIADNSRNLKPRRNAKTSFYKGVSWNKKSKKWMATIKFNQKYYHIGFFDDEIAAAKAYDKMAKKLFGKFAYLNFPNEK